MCGICGIINLNNQNVSKFDIQTMKKIMLSRGPDDQQVFVKDNIGLGFVRLSILDLTTDGRQPMFSEDNNYVIVFNGEVFNYLELKEILIKKGYVFNSFSDTEVVLYSYLEWGEECVNYFNGMWAFAIFNISENKFFISRDRIGIKPFYYYQDEQQIIFASDIKAILKIKPELAEDNKQAVFDFLLTNRTNHNENTFFQNIKKLQHSHNIKIDVINKTFNIYRWYNLSNVKSIGYQNSDEFLEDIIKSTKLQLQSEVPVGLSLSGGIDSSALALIINDLNKNNTLSTFSSIFGENKIGDESYFINLLEKDISNMNYINIDFENFLKDIDSLISCHCEPFPTTSIYSEFKIMEYAKNHCKVLLNGQGVDEYFMGYLDFPMFYYKELIKKFRIKKLVSEIFHYYKIHKHNDALKTCIFSYMPFRIKFKFFKNRNNFLNKNFLKKANIKNLKNDFNELYSPISSKQASINYFEHKFEHHLMWTDKNSMNFSIETRYPYLDHNIVEKAINTKPELIFNKGITKLLLRNAMKDKLVEDIRMRFDKVGFETPEGEWFREKKFRVLFEEIIYSDKFKKREIYDISLVKKMYNQHLQGQNHNKNIWKIFNLELWYRKYIDIN